MIPKDISGSHIAKAAKEIDLNGIPKQRESRRYLYKLERHSIHQNYHLTCR